LRAVQPHQPDIDFEPYGFTVDEFRAEVVLKFEDAFDSEENLWVFRPFKIYDPMLHSDLMVVQTLEDLFRLLLMNQGRAEKEYPTAFPKCPPHPHQRYVSWTPDMKEYQLRQRYQFSFWLMAHCYRTRGPIFTVDRKGHPIFVWEDDRALETSPLWLWFVHSAQETEQVSYSPRLRLLYDLEEMSSEGEYLAYMVGRITSEMTGQTSDSEE